jgi:predicted DNA-binding transcriptional regulator AlpA
MDQTLSSSRAIIELMEFDLVGVPEIADRLGVSRTSVWRYIRREDFPEPVAQMSGKRIWKGADIDRWRKKNPPSKFDHFRRWSGSDVR